MKAGERTLQQILYSPDQYVVPVYQRYYAWKTKDWDQLWDDLSYLLEVEGKDRRHFMGAVVCGPEEHQPGMVPAYQLIDGQQRISTLSILLCAIRDIALMKEWHQLAEEVEENFLIHKHKKGRERFKLFPRQRDRASYLSLIDRKADLSTGQVAAAFQFFRSKLLSESSTSEENLRHFFDMLAARLDFVVITLSKENPFKIFRSLNSTGEDLEEGDLIRNHVFMSLSIEEQDSFDDDFWRPFEAHFEEERKVNGKQLAGFFRDYLTKNGTYVGKDAAFERFEKQYPIGTINAKTVLSELELFAGFYDQILGKKPHPDKEINQGLKMLRGLQVTTAYPLLLNLLSRYATKELDSMSVSLALRSLAGFVFRRFVAGDSSRPYGRWFATACRDLGESPISNLLKFLDDKGWPSDDLFLNRFKSMNLYESMYSFEILSGIELTLQSKFEPVQLGGCWIEHVMPQTIDITKYVGKRWSDALGTDWQRVHRDLLHSPGNLTLVGQDYNNEMKNKPFDDKKPVLSESKVYMNKHFADPKLASWGETEILERADLLAAIASKVWIGSKTAQEKISVSAQAGTVGV